MHGMCGGGMHGRGACVAEGGVCGGGYVWQGAMCDGVCVAGGCAWQGACMAEGDMCARGGVHSKEEGHVWQGACMAGAWQGGHAWHTPPPADTTRYGQ